VDRLVRLLAFVLTSVDKLDTAVEVEAESAPTLVEAPPEMVESAAERLVTDELLVVT
jgi:hypothetical protein